MGTACVCNSELQEELNTDKVISKSIEKDRKQAEHIRQLVFVGCKGVGKSTVIKQLMHLHGAPQTDRELKASVPRIRHYIVSSMRSLIKQCNRTGATFSMQAQQAVASLNALERKQDTAMNEELSAIVSSLWSEPMIKRVFESSMMSVYESSIPYFFEHVAKIQEKDYVPIIEDIVRLPRLDSKFMQTRISVNYYEDNVYDLVHPCAQYAEYNNFLHQFESISGMIFVADLSRYDVTIGSHELRSLVYGYIDLFFDVVDIPLDLIALITAYCSVSDEDSNGIREQLNLFDIIVNHWTLRDVAMILLLNKADLFKEKIKNVPINEVELWRDYEGRTDDFDDQLLYFRDLFEQCNSNSTRDIYTHVIYATDTTNVRKLFGDIDHIVTNWNLDIG